LHWGEATEIAHASGPEDSASRNRGSGSSRAVPRAAADFRPRNPALAVCPRRWGDRV